MTPLSNCSLYMCEIHKNSIVKHAKVGAMGDFLKIGR